MTTKGAAEMKSGAPSWASNPLLEHYNIIKDGIIFEVSATAPSPQRDFHHLLVTTSVVSSRAALEL